jgi:GNAT superfamily N-acetyltransferase
MREELRQRVLDGLEIEIELFGGSSTASRVLRPPGVIAAVSPSTPDRSLFNSVFAADPVALAGSIDSLAATYEQAGVRAWTVWVPDDDRESATLLADRGHALDGSPRSMGLELTDLRSIDRPLPPGVELVEGELRAVARINDLAYAIEADGWEAAIERTPDLPMHSCMAMIDGEPVSCATVLSGGDDACVTAVATLPEHRGKGLASAIVARLLGEARDRGMRTGTLQASKAGAPVYERLGFADVGFIEMWELRGPGGHAAAV